MLDLTLLLGKLNAVHPNSESNFSHAILGSLVIYNRITTENPSLFMQSKPSMVSKIIKSYAFVVHYPKVHIFTNTVNRDYSAWF